MLFHELLNKELSSFEAGGNKDLVEISKVSIRFSGSDKPVEFWVTDFNVKYTGDEITNIKYTCVFNCEKPMYFKMSDIQSIVVVDKGHISKKDADKIKVVV